MLLNSTSTIKKNATLAVARSLCTAEEFSPRDGDCITCFNMGVDILALMEKSVCCDSEPTIN